MSNPLLVEVFRGDTVESIHRGAIAVVDSYGRSVFALGDVEHPIFPRSAVKAIQALPLVESGAADAYGFGAKELALACASHSGEPAHVDIARAMQAKAGLNENMLKCGVHWLSSHEATVALARSGGSPSALHNNCSGKHSGFLCVCRHCGIYYRGYVGAGHAFQEMMRNTDGGGYRRAPRRWEQGHRRLLYVAGTARACTRLMEAAPGRVFAKVGAEGVYCAAIEELGLGIAVKCDDGASRAAEVMVGEVLSQLLSGDPDVSEELRKLARPELHNRRGILVGRLQPAATLRIHGRKGRPS